MSYMGNVWESLSTLAIGMKVTIGHMFKIRRGNVTLQYPVERWPRPERKIGFSADRTYKVTLDDVTSDGFTAKTATILISQ